MSTGTKKRYTFNIYEIDLSSIDPTVRAILLPASKSAAYSTQLPENSPQIISITNLVPLSPQNSSSESEGAILESSNHITRYKQKYPQLQHGIALKQSREDARFTFGTSLDNNVVLRHPDSSHPKDCYINLQHAQLYPDPDHDTFRIYNCSATTFAVQSLATIQSCKHISPGQATILDNGSYCLTFGKGLCFQFRILPRHPKAAHATWSPSLPLVLPSSVTLEEKGSLSKRMREAQSTNTRLEASLVYNEDVESDGDRDSSNTSGGSIFHGFRASDVSCNPEVQGIKPTGGELELHKTDRARVVKTTRNGMIVVVKKFRGEDLKEVADRWRNEVEILKVMNHGSITQLVDYDASDLSLELEYVGPDLTKMIDNKERRMSRLSKPSRYRVWIDIARALEYLHAKNIIHLDVKPSNILLRGQERAVLCDFEMSTQGAAEMDGGTASYVPPEFLLREARGAPGDIWAFGVTLLFVFGQIPLPRQKWKLTDIASHATQMKMNTWLNKVEGERENLPRSLFLLRQMLSNNPKKRITASQLCNKLLKHDQRFAGKIAA
ncbi:kinase-like protein [Acephala macrosclerotiorum]|nr:kinase-like protein [Acephala macrosclerotiorum]